MQRPGKRPPLSAGVVVPAAAVTNGPEAFRFVEDIHNDELWLGPMGFSRSSIHALLQTYNCQPPLCVVSSLLLCQRDPSVDFLKKYANVDGYASPPDITIPCATWFSHAIIKHSLLPNCTIPANLMPFFK